MVKYSYVVFLKLGCYRTVKLNELITLVVNVMLHYLLFL
jgi:hypothetical protein